MRSVLSYILPWATWYLFKGCFASPEALKAQIDKEKLKEKKLVTPSYEPSSRIQKKANFQQRVIGGHPVYEVTSKSGRTPKSRVLFIHGGAFIFEITPLHWRFVIELADHLDAVVTVPIYPLGPDHSLLDMYDMLRPLYQQMAESWEETPFIAIGDSAGGHLSLGLTQEAVDEGRKTAARLVLITPSVDTTFSNPDVVEKAKDDPWMDVPGCREIKRIICPDLSGDDPRASPIHGVLDGLPPLQVFAAEKDLLTPDTMKFVDLVKQRGAEAELIVGDAMLHCWPLMPMDEGRKAREQIFQFVGKSMTVE